MNPDYPSKPKDDLVPVTYAGPLESTYSGVTEAHGAWVPSRTARLKRHTEAQTSTDMVSALIERGLITGPGLYTVSTSAFGGPQTAAVRVREVTQPRLEAVR